MSEGELVAAFQGYIALTNQIFFGYVGLLSGFLVMSYLVADKISIFLASIAVGLFSLVSSTLIFGILLNRNDAEQLMALMLEQRGTGNLDLPWLGTNPPWAATTTTFLYITVTIGGYLACVAYFFYKRNYQSRGQ